MENNSKCIEMKSVYVYIRVSTNKQEVLNQRHEIERWCQSRNIVPSKWISEVVSGTVHSKNRRIGSILEKLKPGDTLIVAEISRISRNLYQIMEILNNCMKKNVVVMTVKEGFVLGDNINSKVLAFAFGLAAEIERNLISQRTKEALLRLKSEGKVLGRPKGSRNRRSLLIKYNEQIRQLKYEGKSQAYISRKLKIHRHTVAKWEKENL